MAVPVLGNWLFPDKDKADYTAEEKQALSAIVGVLSVGETLATGGGRATDAAANVVAMNAMKNNYLTEISLEKVKKGILTEKEAEQLSSYLDSEVKRLCATDPYSDACHTGISSQRPLQKTHRITTTGFK